MFRRNIEPVSIVLFVGALFVVGFAVSQVITTSAHHDYISYMQQWGSILRGHNPWADPSNAYGPVHSVLALLYAFHPKLPRLLFVCLWLLCSFGISLLASKNAHLPDGYKYALYTILLLNPLFWIFVVNYGTNDILMAFFVLLGIVFFKGEKDVLSGVCMGIAVAVKFIPVVMVPFLVFSRSNVRWRFAMSFLITVVGIFTVSHLVWGPGVLYPLQLCHERPSKLLSIFRFLRGRASPLRLFADDPDLDWLSVYVCLGLLAALFFLHIRRGCEAILSSIMSIVVLLTVSKLGHHQFYITLVMVITWWISVDYKRIMDTGFPLVSVFAFMIWLSFLSFLYVLTGGYQGTGWREVLGLPTFILSGWMLIDLIGYSLNVAGRYGPGHGFSGPPDVGH